MDHDRGEPRHRAFARGRCAGLLASPVNVLVLSLHPEGLAPRIENLAEWRRHLLERLQRQIEASADPALADLLQRLESLPSPRVPDRARHAPHGPLVPIRLRVGRDTLAMFSTTTVFGTPVEITLSELAIESFFPADETTADALRRMFPHPA